MRPPLHSWQTDCHGDRTDAVRVCQFDQPHRARAMPFAAPREVALPQETLNRGDPSWNLIVERFAMTNSSIIPTMHRVFAFDRDLERMMNRGAQPFFAPLL